MLASYTLIIGFLFLLAVSLLVVGVSNDAVNFLNSAIGSKVASFSFILVVAAAGVLIGAVFSNGMMEVARKGIFNPEHFAFDEIMVIFLTVMLTNLLLLDFFNTVGLPTSTTVSIVFGILGAAVAVAVFKIKEGAIENGGLAAFINFENSLIIIAGIFLSVVIAFNAGVIVQWIVRIAFSFNHGRNSRYWSAIWGGFAVTAILYFLLIKGASGSTLVSEKMLAAIQAHTTKILLVSLLGWSLIFQLLLLFTRINVMRITVLVGTFALAMAFAGNDLVNFIGVPLAGFESFKIFQSSGGGDASGILMGGLQAPVRTPIYFLIAAGLIMVLTLRFSKKARSVTATTIDLSRQEEGTERFASTSLARFIVRKSVEMANGIEKITPGSFGRFIHSRFNLEEGVETQKEKVAFDQVRASVNLVVASILIAFGTSLKLPLSTTYVTFMVAMGTSLADGAWGKDSAVYRVTGVLTVIGGWFFTALMAFLASFLIATLIYFGKLPVILLLAGLSVYVLLKTHAFHRRRARNVKKQEAESLSESLEVLQTCDEQVKTSIRRVSGILNRTYTNFFKERHKELKHLKKEVKALTKEIKQIGEDIPDTLRRFRENDLGSGHHYVQVVAYMKEMSNSTMHIVLPAFNHLDNNHAIDREKNDRLKEFNEQIDAFLKEAIDLLDEKNGNLVEDLVRKRDELIELANEILVHRIKILKRTKKGIKFSMTYIEMLSETKNLLLDVVQLVKSDLKLFESLDRDEIRLESDMMPFHGDLHMKVNKN
ncbi:MAG: inorganic phosphate transporter [Bacteroidales bacterium]